MAEELIHQVGDVWKVGNKWMAKLPGQIVSRKTRKGAQLWADTFKDAKLKTNS